MKKAFIIILVCIITCTAYCSNNKKQLQDNVKIEKNVDSMTLIKNLDSYIEYKGELFENNKRLKLTFTFKEGVTVPENPPKVEVKIYLWKSDKLIGIYNQQLYNCYDNYLNPVILGFYADGKTFNRYEVLYNAESIND